MLILFISVVAVKNIEPLLHFLDVVYNIYREEILVNLDTVFIYEKTRVTKKKGTFPHIESIGVQDLFFIPYLYTITHNCIDNLPCVLDMLTGTNHSLALKNE